jgi:hypothetical protein
MKSYEDMPKYIRIGVIFFITMFLVLVILGAVLSDYIFSDASGWGYLTGFFCDGGGFFGGGIELGVYARNYRNSTAN